jgi:hypothetical protein
MQTKSKSSTDIPRQVKNPDFEIVVNTDSAFSHFNRKIEVFGIPIYAVEAVDDAKLLHTANVTAQYLDNNEDGIVDNQAVLSVMQNKDAFYFMWSTEADMERVKLPSWDNGQDLGND